MADRRTRKIDGHRSWPWFIAAAIVVLLGQLFPSFLPAVPEVLWLGLWITMLAVIMGFGLDRISAENREIRERLMAIEYQVEQMRLSTG